MNKSENSLPSGIKELVKAAILNLLPSNSKKLYESTYKNFDDCYVVHGPQPFCKIPEEAIGKILFDNLMKYSINNDAALVDAHTEKIITYRTLLDESCNLAVALKNFGCEINTVLSICSGNSLEFFIPVIASLFAGTTIAPINQFYTERELKHILQILEPKIIFVSENVASKFLQLQNDLKCIKKIIVIDSNNTITGTQDLKTFIQEQLMKQKVIVNKFEPWKGDVNNQLAFILCSSGTTGLPKGVMITHKNFAVRLAQVWDSRFALPYKATALGLLPFFHGYGFTTGLTSILSEVKIVIMKKFDEIFLLECIQKYKINTMHMPPPIATFLAKTPFLNNYDVSSIKQLHVGAAPLSKQIEDPLRQRLNLKAISQGYGLTEALLTVLKLQNHVNRTGSCGKVTPYFTVKVRDPETGKSLGPNQVGEICAKGPMVMKGYYKNEQATNESFTSDGWLRTGDLGYYDEDKFFYIVDRLKELIKYKGFQVAPAELEAILINHPKVLDVGVVGLPDEVAGELPTAFVVKKTEDVTEAELKTFVAKNVSPQKALRGGVIFIKSIPKNASGKILRRTLREQLTNYKLQQQSKL